MCEMFLLTESCCETPEATFHEPLSDVDQNVLYYISGFMAMKLQAPSVQSCKLQQLECLVLCLTTLNQTYSSILFTNTHNGSNGKARVDYCILLLIYV